MISKDTLKVIRYKTRPKIVQKMAIPLGEISRNILYHKKGHIVDLKVLLLPVSFLSIELLPQFLHNISNPTMRTGLDFKSAH